MNEHKKNVAAAAILLFLLCSVERVKGSNIIYFVIFLLLRHLMF